MLKRLRVRSKLLLLLAPVLAAVVFFAASSAQDRFDAATVAENEAEVATLADAGDQLLLALQVEQIRTLAAQAGADVDVESAVVATSEAAARFEEVAARVAGFAGPETAPALSTARQRVATIPELRARVDQGGMSAGANQVQFDAILFSLDRLGDALLAQVADVGLYRDLAAHQRLTRAQDALGRLVARAEVGVIEGLDRVTSDDLRVQLVAANLALEQFRSDATEDQVRILDRTTSRLGLPDNGDALAATLGAMQAGDPARALEGWTERGESWLKGLAEVGSSLAGQAVAAAESRADLANGEAAGFLVLASIIVVAALVLAVLVGRSISRPLRRLTRDAQRLADDELPALVETLRSGRVIDRDVLEPISVSGRDETAELARAVASIQEMTVEVAEEQSALLRKGISEMFVNLARRNQALLDRQIKFIDELERREEDPDRLEELFRLDHLATRMRRNAESLLVLAGADPTRRRGQPVEIGDVVQVAISEVEDFARIDMLGVEPARVPGNAAVDLAHLLSELMENATQFSPPETRVEVAGHLAGDGSYQLTVTDHGIGMSADQLARANEILHDPPVIGLELGRSLGFTVVSRIAARLGLGAQVTTSTQGGVTALVVLPPTLVVGGEPAASEPPAREPVAPPEPPAATRPEPVPPVPTPEPPAATRPEPVPPVPNPEPVTAAPEPFATPVRGVEAGPIVPDQRDTPGPLEQLARLLEGSDPGLPPATVGGSGPAVANPAPSAPDVFSPLEDALRRAAEGPSPRAPGGELPRRREPPTSPALPSRRPAEPAAPTIDGSNPPAGVVPPPPGESVAAASSLPPPPVRPAAEVAAVDERLTRAGLVRRRPRRVEVPETSRYGAPAPVTATARDPEEVRQMLSRYRSGLRKGRRARREGSDPHEST